MYMALLIWVEWEDINLQQKIYHRETVFFEAVFFMRENRPFVFRKPGVLLFRIPDTIRAELKYTSDPVEHSRQLSLKME